MTRQRKPRKRVKVKVRDIREVRIKGRGTAYIEFDPHLDVDIRRKQRIK